MSGFVIQLTSMMCLLVILTGPVSSALQNGPWKPALPVPQTYPSDPNDPYYQAFQKVPFPDVTAEKLMTNFLGYPHSAGIVKRQTSIDDVVIVMDGSGSIPYCEFAKGKEALKHLMGTLHRDDHDSKYAAVTFSTTATVNFKFLPYSSAASKITTIPYPGGSTNTQAGLAEAKKLFDDPNSGRRPLSKRKMVFLVTDGQSTKDAHLTVPKALELKSVNGVKIFVVAVGSYISGIDEMVKIASNPSTDLLRVKDFDGLWHLVQLIVNMVSPEKYHIVNYDPPCQ